jgi:WD40 repeat protein
MSIKFWNTTTSNLLRSIDNAHSSAIVSLAYHNNNKRLLASSSKGMDIKIWNTNTYALVATLTDHGTNPVSSLAFDPSRPGIMASGSQDRTIKLWDLNVAAPSDNTSLVTTLTGHSETVNCVAFETTGLMASGDDYGVVIIWETNRTVKFNIDSYYNPGVLSLAFSLLANNRLLASGHMIFRVIQLWNPSTGIQVGTLTGHYFTVQTLAFNQNGLLASGSWGSDIKLWNVTTKTEYKTLSGHTSGVTSVAFRSDGLLASGSDDTNVRIWY